MDSTRTKSNSRRLLVVLVFLSCAVNPSPAHAQPPPRAVDGLLDLSRWDFKAGESFKIEGTCRLYPGRLLDPTTIGTVPASESVPQGIARNWSIQNEYPSFPARGFGTYTLVILLPGPETDLGFIIPNQDSAFRLWIDGETAAENGKVSADPAAAVPEYRPATYFCHSKTERIALVMQVSNYHVRCGGWGNAIYIGNPGGVAGKRMFLILLSLIPIICLTTLFIYHIMSFLFRKKEIPYLFFSLSILGIILGDGFGGEYLFTAFPAIPWQVGWRIMFASTALFVLFFTLYIGTLFPREVPRGFRKAVIALYGLISLACFTMPAYLVSVYLTVPLQAVSVAVGLALTAMIALAAFRRRENAWFISAGILALAFLGATDSMATSLIGPFMHSLGPLLGWGFVGFLFLHSLVLSRRFAFAYGRLDHLTENLEREVKERTAELKESNARLDEANRSKTDFFLHFAHEIRTPLTLLVNTMDEYIKAGDSRATRAVDPRLENVRAYIEILLKEILDFFDAIRFDKGISVYSHDALLDLSAFARGKLEMYVSTAAARGLRVIDRVVNGVIVKADPAAVDRIFNNLLDNAVKYNSPGGTIEVAISSNDAIRLEVADTGIGIDDEDRELVFLPYYRTGTGKGRIQGMGLGLAIVRDIVGSLAGNIRIEPNEPRGTRFVISLPRPPGDAAAGKLVPFSPFLTPIRRSEALESQREAAAPQDAPVVLVVEDNEELRRLIVATLSGHYRVRQAAEGDGALALLRGAEAIDLILSDVVMEGMDGFRLLEAVKANEAWREIPFLFLSALALEGKKLEAYRAGILDWIAKPFRANELLAKIDSLVRHDEIRNGFEEKRRLEALGLLLSSVAHEIYNPLSGITGPLAVIEKRMREDGPAATADCGKYLEHIRSSATRIEAILSTIRDIHERKTIKVEPIDLGRAVSDAIQRTAPRRDVILRNDVPANTTVLAHALALERILDNLVANALESIPGEGTVRFAFAPGQGGAGGRFSIEDTGSGMDAAVAARAFEPFFTEKVSGHMGMGLYAVRLFAQELGWKCELRSEPGRGTTVAFEVPDRC